MIRHKTPNKTNQYGFPLHYYNFFTARTELESLRKALEAENDVAMNAMKNKMIELQKKHVTMLDEMRKKHIKEKEVLIKQGQITAGRGVTPTAHTVRV